MFKNFRDYVNDPIEAMFIRLAEDHYPDKIDLGIGVFRDEFGNVPVMDVVRQAESRLISRGFRSLTFPHSATTIIVAILSALYWVRITPYFKHHALYRHRLRVLEVLCALVQP